MGTKRERQPGVWQLRVSAGVDPVTGGRRVITETFRGSERAAGLRLAELETDANRNLVPTVATLRTAIKQWRAATDHAPGTSRNYDTAYKAVPKKVLDTSLSKLRADTLRALYDDVINRYGIHRCRSVHALVSGALTWAWQQEWVNENVARRVRPPAPPKRRRTDPTADEVRRLLAAAYPDPEMYAYVRVLATLGARKQEALALRWSHVDFTNRQVQIFAAVDPVTGELKNVKADGERNVAVSAQTIAGLRRWRKAFVERALAIGITPTPDPFLFSRDLEGRQPWRPDYGTKRFIALRDAAARITVDGEPFSDEDESAPISARLHDLRHFVATELLNAGVPAKTVAGRLGHSRVATTTDLYGHAIPASDEAAASEIERRLG